MFHLSQADSKSKGSLSPQRKTKVKTFGGDVTDLVGMVMMVVMMMVMVKERLRSRPSRVI